MVKGLAVNPTLSTPNPETLTSGACPSAGAGNVMSDSELMDLALSPQALPSYQYLPAAALRLREAAGEVEGNMADAAAALRYYMENVDQEEWEEYEEDLNELLEVGGGGGLGLWGGGYRVESGLWVARRI